MDLVAAPLDVLDGPVIGLSGFFFLFIFLYPINRGRHKIALVNYSFIVTLTR